jgi:TetR/AcrR family transcriptional regulator, transcriptional repressor for nem operon
MTAKKDDLPAANRAPVKQRILDVAEQCAQMRGFNGFSYADVAEKLLCTKASLHYHFPSKADLGRALIERYHRVFGEALETIDRQAHGVREKLRRYVGLYDSVMRNDRMCLCGMFAAEYATLPAPMQNELRLFFDANEVWLAAVLEEGRRAGELAFRGSAKQRARSVLGSLEGAMLVARAYGDGRRFQSAAKQVLADLSVERAVEPRLQSRAATGGVPAHLD